MVLIVLALDRAEDTIRVDLDIVGMLMLDRSGRTDVESRPDCYSSDRSTSAAETPDEHGRETKLINAHKRARMLLFPFPIAICH